MENDVKELHDQVRECEENARLEREAMQDERAELQKAKADAESQLQAQREQTKALQAQLDQEHTQHTASREIIEQLRAEVKTAVAAAAEAEQTAAAVDDDDVVLTELRDELCSVKSECEKLRARVAQQEDEAQEQGEAAENAHVLARDEINALKLELRQLKEPVAEPEVALSAATTSSGDVQCAAESVSKLQQFIAQPRGGVKRRSTRRSTRLSTATTSENHTQKPQGWVKKVSRALSGKHKQPLSERPRNSLEGGAARMSTGKSDLTLKQIQGIVSKAKGKKKKDVQLAAVTQATSSQLKNLAQRLSIESADDDDDALRTAISEHWNLDL